jgi:hypothetical protein
MALIIVASVGGSQLRVTGLVGITYDWQPQ